ncbi:MAG TPA: MFS transporter, partial [bacterium]|nr:MFS transporter [bacterium]
YVVERLMRGPSTTVANLAALGTALLLLPVALQMVKRLGKARGLMIAMAAFALGFILLSQLGRLPAPPLDLERIAAKRAEHGRPATIEELRADFEPEELAGDPATPNLRWPVGLAILCGLGLPLAIFFITPNAILADVIDLDRLAHGPGREGMFFAAQAVVIQSGGAASGWVLNRVLTEGSEQATLGGIAAVGPVAAAIIAVGIVILARFRWRIGEGRSAAHSPATIPQAG